MSPKVIPPSGGPRLTVIAGSGGPRPAALPVLGQPGVVEERADAARNRERIMAAARKLLGRRCISELSMDDVAEAAGVGKGTLYRRFKDRASLCHALLDDEERKLQESVMGGLGLPAAAGPEERLEALFRALAGFVLNNVALLAEALAFHAGRGDDVYAHPTRQWRRFEVMRHMARLPHWAGVSEDVRTAVADTLVTVFDPRQAAWLRMQGHSDESIRAAWLAVARGALAGGQR